MNQVEVKSRQLQAVSMALTLLTFAVAAKLTGYNGAAYLAAALEAVTVVWAVVGGNLADSLGRILRVRGSRGQYKNAARLRRNAMIFQMAFGLAGSLLLFAGAGWIAESVFRLRYSMFVLMVLSPVVFLRSVSSVLLGYFQGEGTQLPTAVSGILRQVFILGFSLLFGRLLGDYGQKVSRLLVQENFTSMYGGVGVGIAVSVSEVFIVIFLYLIYRGSRRGKERLKQEGMRGAAVSFADSIRILWGGRGLHWLMELLLFLPIPLGFIFLQKRALGDAAVREYGIYAAMYWVLCGVCVSLVTALLLPVSARTAACLRKDEQRFARTVFQSGIHIGLVHALFASVFLAVMAPQLAGLFCPGTADTARRMLQGGSFAVVLLVLIFYIGRLLVMTGGKLLVLGAVGISDVVYVVSVTVLLNTEKTGILSLVYAGVAGLSILLILLGTFCFRQIRTQPDWLQLILKPGGAAAGAGLVCALLAKLFTPHLGNGVTVLAAFLVSGAIYWMILLLVRDFREQELEVIPGGRLIRSLGQMLRVY